MKHNQIQSADKSKRTELMGLMSFLFLAGYSLLVLWRDPPKWIFVSCIVVLLVSWGALILGYVLAARRSGNFQRYIKEHIWQLAMLVLPFFYPLQFLRLIPFLGYLDKKLAKRSRDRVVTYVVSAIILLAFFSALTVYGIERDAPGATIHSFGDALWWAAATVTTVGYGDVYPVTTAGRISALFLMVGSFILLSTVTGAIATYMLERIQTPGDGHRDS